MTENSTPFPPGLRDVEDAETVMQKIAAAFAGIIPPGCRSVTLVCLDARNIDCLHNFDSMDDAADAIRIYLERHETKASVARIGPVRTN